MKFAFIFIFCCLQGVIVKSQTQDSLEAIKYIDSVHQSIEINNVDNAHKFYQLAYYHIKKTNDLRLFVIEHKRLCDSLFKNHRNIVDQCDFLDWGQDSLWRSSKNIDEFKAVSNNLISVAYYYGEYLDNIQDRISILKEVESIYIDTLNISEPILAYVFNQLGNDYNRLGEQKKAETYFKKAYAISFSLGSTFRTASILNNAGMVFRNESLYDTARIIYIKAAQLNVSDFVLRTTILESLAEAYCELGKLDSCRITLEKLVEDNELNGSPNSDTYHENRAYIHKNYANYYLKKGQYDKATFHYNKLLTFSEFLDGRELAYGYLALGELQFEIGNLSEAIANFDSAYNVFYPHIHPDSFSVTSDLNISSGNIDVSIRHAKSLAIYFEGKANYLERSLSEIDKAIQIDDALLFKTLEFEESRLNALRRRRTYIDHAIKVCYELWKKTKDKSYKLKALEYSEMSRANLLYVERSRLVDINPDFEDAKYIVFLKDSLSILRDKIRIASEEDILKLEWAHKNVHEELNNSYLGIPEYMDSTNLKSRLKKLPNDQAIVEYYYTTTDSTLTSFVVTRNGVKVFRKSIKKDLSKSISSMYTHLEDYGISNEEKPFNAFKEQALELYEILLLDIHAYLEEQRINSIKISADGPLNNLAFDILLTKQSDSSYSFSNLPFVLNDLTISHIHSINFYLDFQQNHHYKANSSNFVCFVPDYPKVQYLNPQRGSAELYHSLPGAKEEALKAQKIFSGKRYSGSKATKANFKKYAPKYNNILLSMHASLDTLDANFSSLVFQEQGAEFEQMLYAHELSQLNFNADLLVLSTCNSGKGTFFSGEGAMSLSRRFAQQGVRATVMGLWAIPDQETSEIIPTFYDYIKSGHKKDKALQLAKIDFIKNHPLNASPLLWAGLSISGNMEPIVSQSIPFWIWLLLLTAVGLVIILFFSKKHLPRR